jgi:hypothetical protein
VCPPFQKDSTTAVKNPIQRTDTEELSAQLEQERRANRKQ